MNYETWRVLREEGWRSVAWFCLSLLGWSVIYTATDPPVLRAGTTMSLVALTTLLLAGVTVGVRLLLGWELKGYTHSKPVLNLIGGSAVAGFAVLYAILVRGYSPFLFGLYLAGVVTLGAGQLWRLSGSSPTGG